MRFFRPAAPGQDPGLLVSVRTFWRVLVSSLHTRLDLFLTELGEEAFRLMYLVLAGIIGVISLHGAFFFFMLWILAAFWDTEYRLWVIGGIFLVYIAVAITCAVIARNMILSRPRFLGQTLEELKKDVAGLQTAIKPTETQP